MQATKTGGQLARVSGRMGCCVALFAAGLSLAHAASHTWSGASDTKWSNAANWSVGGVPVAGEANLVLNFPLGANNLINSNDIDNLAVVSIVFGDGGYDLSGKAIGISSDITFVNAGGGTFNKLEMDIAVTGTLTANVGGPNNNPFGMSFIGTLSGGALNKTGAGSLQLFGTNTYTGATTVAAGDVSLYSSSALGTGAAVVTVADKAHVFLLSNVSISKPLVLGSFSDLHAITGNNTWSGPITVNGTNATGFSQIIAQSQTTLLVSGPISGPGGIFVGTGSGAVTFSAANTYVQATALGIGSGADLTVLGAQTQSGVGLSGSNGGTAILRGTGSVGSIAEQGGKGLVQPGTAVATGILTAAGLNLRNNSTLQIRINGTSAGTSYDQLIVGGPVQLTGSTLNLIPGYAGNPGDSITIIKNNGNAAVTGTFAGLPNGATLVAGGITFRISYAAGGSGRDVVLTVTQAAPHPVLSLNPLKLDFGNVVIGSSASLSAQLTNTGTATLNLGTLTLGGANPADFTRGGSCADNVALAAQASCTLSFSFSPGARGARSAALTILSNASSSPDTLPLSGNGLLPPTAVLLPATLDFGNQNLNTPSTVQTVTVTNNGDVALSGLNFSFSGANPGDFSVDASGCAGSVASHASCSVSVRFTPPANGARAASLDMTSNAANGAQHVALSGNGVAPAPALKLSPTSLAFGNQQVGTSSPNLSPNVTNTGTANLVLGHISLVGTNAADFTLGSGGTCTDNLMLAPGATCGLSIRFTPSASGARVASVNVTSNAASSPDVLNLSGTGTPAPSLIATTTNLSAAPNPATVNQSVTASVVIGSNVQSVNGSPTGTVSIGDGTVSCLAILTNGSGNCALTFASAGTHTLTATYAGDANYAGSIGTYSETVARGATTILLSAAPNPTLINQAVAVTASVQSSLAQIQLLRLAAQKAGAAPEATTPTGTVTINVSDGSAGCTATLINGSVSCGLVFATSGTRTLTATYSGDGNYQPASATLDLSVIAATGGPVAPAPMLERWTLVVLLLAMLGVVWHRRRRM